MESSQILNSTTDINDINPEMTSKLQNYGQNIIGLQQIKSHPFLQLSEKKPVIPVLTFAPSTKQKPKKRNKKIKKVANGEKQDQHLQIPMNSKQSSIACILSVGVMTNIDKLSISSKTAKKSQFDLMSIMSVASQSQLSNHFHHSSTQLESSFELRQNEMEILESIYPEDITILEPILDDSYAVAKTESHEEENCLSKGKFQVRVYPHTSVDQNFCFVNLLVTYRAGYPSTLPNLQILRESCKGVNEQQVQEIQEAIQKCAEEESTERHQAIVYDVILVIQNILELINQQTSQFKRQQQTARGDSSIYQTPLKKNLTESESAKNETESAEEDKIEGVEGSSYYYDEQDESHSLSISQQSQAQPKQQTQSNLNIQQLRQEQEHQLIQEGFDWRKLSSQLAGVRGPAFSVLPEPSKFQEEEDESLSFRAITQATQMMHVARAGSSTAISRYKQDFEELEKIGEGGAGRVFKARHKIDRNIYAIKKVRLYRRDEEENERIKREVTVISRLHNQHIVRYFQAWVEYLDDETEIKELAFSESDVDEADENDEESLDGNDDEEYSKSEESDILESRYKPYNSESDCVSRSSNDDDNDYYCEDEDSESIKSDSDYFRRQSKIQKNGKTKGKKVSQNKKYYKNLASNKNKLRKKKEIAARKQSQIIKQQQKSKFKDKKKENKPEKDNGIQILYIQMEFCEGNNLRNFIVDFPDKQNEDQKWKIFCQVVDALHYLHGIGLIHRDLKPSNIFLDKNNNVKLGDFGLATQHHHGTSKYQESSASLNKFTKKQQAKFKVFELLKQQRSFAYKNKGDKGSNLIQMEDADEEKENGSNPSRSTMMHPSSSMSMQAHSVGIGTPAYMAPEQKKGEGKYNYLADMYSLGLIFFEMWAGFQTLIEMDKACQLLKNSNEISKDYEKKIPENARKLILWLTTDRAAERPSTIQLLQSELMPHNLEDEVFKKFIYSISNHKTIESIQLMNFLLKRKTPKNIDLTYESYILDQASQKMGLMTTGHNQFGMQNGMAEYSRYAMDEQVAKEAIAKSVLKKIFKSVFALHGAVDLDIPIIAPVQDSATVFLSMRQQICSKDRRQSHNSEGSGKTDNVNASGLTEDKIHSLEIDLFNETARYQESITHQQNAQLLNYLKERNIQKVTYLNMEQQLITQRLLDETGIVLQLQPNLNINFARYMARKQLPFVKRYHIGKTFKKNQSYQRTSPQEFLEASFDIVSMPNNSHFTSGDEFIYEAEVIKVCEQIAQAYTKEFGNKYKIRINSSEILDGIMDEGRVKIENRYKVLKLIATMFDKYPWTAIKKELLIQNLVSHSFVEKMGDLLKIRGSIMQVEQQIKNHKAIRKTDRFRKCIEYFKSIRNYLKYYGILEDDGIQAQGCILFDFGLALENQFTYYSGLIFKLVVPAPIDEQGNTDQISNIGIKHQKKKIHEFKLEHRQQSNLKGGQTANMKGQTTTNTGLPSQAFQSLEASSKPLPVSARGSAFIQNYETLAVGGRYDNLIAHFQPMEIPIAIGVRFFCNKFLKKMLSSDSQQKKDQMSSYSPLDVYIVSIGDMTSEKLELLNELWRHGIRAEAHLGSDFQLQELNHQFGIRNLKFLITFKKAVFANTKKVKVKDFESKSEKDEVREGIAEKIKNRLKYHGGGNQYAV